MKFLTAEEKAELRREALEGGCDAYNGDILALLAEIASQDKTIRSWSGPVAGYAEDPARQLESARQRIAELEFEAKLSRESAEANYADRAEERRALLGRIDELEKDLATFQGGLKAIGMLNDMLHDRIDEAKAAAQDTKELERELDEAGGTLYATLRWASAGHYDLARAATQAKLTIERHEEEERSMRESIRSLTKERDALRRCMDACHEAVGEDPGSDDETLAEGIRARVEALSLMQIRIEALTKERDELRADFRVRWAGEKKWGDTDA